MKSLKKPIFNSTLGFALLGSVLIAHTVLAASSTITVNLIRLPSNEAYLLRTAQDASCMKSTEGIDGASISGGQEAIFDIETDHDFGKCAFATSSYGFTVTDSQGNDIATFSYAQNDVLTYTHLKPSLVAPGYTAYSASFSSDGASSVTACVVPLGQSKPTEQCNAYEKNGN